MALVSLALSWMAYALFYHTDVESEQKKFQQNFLRLEKQQNEFLTTLSSVVNEHSLDEIWGLEKLQKSPLIVQLYKNDSLVYWNDNHISLQEHIHTNKEKFTDLLPNGYFWINTTKVHDIKVFVASKIKNEFYYQNSSLQNTLSADFLSKNEIDVELTQENDGFPIVSKDGVEQLYIHILPTKTIGTYKQLTIFLLFIIGIISVLNLLVVLLLPIAKEHTWLIPTFPLTLLLVRYLSIQNTGLAFFKDFELYDANLYAQSDLIPNLGSLIISLSFLFISIWWGIYFLKRINEKTKRNALVLVVVYIGLLTYSMLISELFESLIINSSINLVIDEVFSLDLYSLIVLLIFAFLFLSYYLIIRVLSVKLVNSTIKLTTLAMIWFFSGVVFYLIEIFYFEHNALHTTWPVLLNALFFYLAAKKSLLNTLKYHIAIIVVFSFYGAIILFKNNEINEHQKRELYANQLITDQDPTMEFEYMETIESLLENPSFYQIINEVDYFSAPYFSLQIENCCFGSYWEQYDIHFFFFREDGSPLLEYISDKERTKESLTHIIEHHSTTSTIAEQLYFIKDYHDNLSYIGHEKVSNDKGETLDFFILFKSKKIPEKIGFPRLLMNEKSYALQNLEDYSIARYSDNELVMKFGSYNYPRTIHHFKDKVDTKPSFRTIRGVNHLTYKQADEQGVIISKPEKRFIEQLSTFSYLVIFFGVFSLIVLLFIHWKSIFRLRALQLSLKVQTVVIGMMVAAFGVFMIIATKNVRQQNNINTLEALKEKTLSVESVVGQRMADREEIIPEIHGDYLNYLLKRLSYSFVADINFYTVDGNLLASSQTKLYEKGISSRQINNLAFYHLNYRQRSEYFHKEKYGKLAFLSGYTPLANHDGNILGYINLQQFSKQNILERQLNEFIVSIINVSVLLLVVSVLVAIIVSGWITAPLRLIQQSFAKVELGKENKPIEYSGDDEIGALVKEYNNKLAELELKALQLARSERETAWREMAKQVAHEIKNPLTPMKLSVQHFQRTYDPDDPRSRERMQRLLDSLIEQIDALTNIANEFSNFAKMPKANEEELNLVPLVEKIVELYSSPDVEIQFVNKTNEEVLLFADKELLLRVFNNLVKNAIQAAKEGEKAQIRIEIEGAGKNYLISVKDKGIGISKEIQDKMFVPNFTTKSTGSGLGLAMTKQIINTHNGDIWFESEEGVGTTFWVEMPRLL